jgi:asparagine synthase (glutamine-hydrolysing)
MSAIAGVLSPTANHLTSKMLETIAHRGSTPPNVWSGANAAIGSIGFEKLCEQPGPILSMNEDRAIVFDGRLVNKTALLEELGMHSLRTEIDAEVAMHLYEEFGTRAIGRMEGEFAMALVENEHILLARDRLGIRPLYYGFSDGSLCFASEIKALLGIVDQIHEFPPGHFLLSHWGIFPYDPYLPKSIQLDGALDSAERLASYLRQAVEKVIGDQTEAGIWLSGGVDSSVIAALARLYVDRLYTFSAGVDGAPDVEYARQVAGHIGAEHHERIYTLREMQ